MNKKNNPFGKSLIFFWLGIFVWGDAVVIGLFWFLISLICFLLKDWILFLLIISTFWIVRSLGEIIYWINQQFSPIIRNPPETLFGYKLFKNDSIWFIYQVFWQCAMVVSIIFSILLTRVWINRL
ncbi:MAG: hypothetical protein PHR98_03755 [Candidatus Shapirobacteria bacterium]|nr:hypothetical protein [Candidatus Shapirobacteria bacterium]